MEYNIALKQILDNIFIQLSNTNINLQKKASIDLREFVELKFGEISSEQFSKLMVN
jgi:hypothetical protein